MVEEPDPQFSFLLWFGQSLLACWGPLLFWATMEMDSAAGQAFGYVFIAACSGGLAVFVSRFIPRAMLEGVTVAFIPATVWVCAFLTEALPERGDLHNFFYFTPGPGHGEEALGVCLLTLPTWSCCWYSGVLWWSRRHARRLVSAA